MADAPRGVRFFCVRIFANCVGEQRNFCLQKHDVLCLFARRTTRYSHNTWNIVSKYNTAHLNNIVLKSNLVTHRSGTSDFCKAEIAPLPYRVFGIVYCVAKSLRSLRWLLYLFSYVIPHSSFERRFPLHIVSRGLLLPFLPLYFAVLCNFTIIFGCFNVKNHLSCSIPLQTLFSLSKQ